MAYGLAPFGLDEDTGGPIRLSVPVSVITLSAPAPDVGSLQVNPPAAALTAAALPPTVALHVQTPAATVSLAAPAPDDSLRLHVPVAGMSLAGEAPGVLLLPAPPSIPAGVPAARVERASYHYPAPTVVNGQPQGWTYDSLTREQWAKYIQVVIGGEDWTFARDVPTEILNWTEETPGSWGTAVIRLPAYTSYDGLSGALADFALGPPVQFWQILPDGSRGRLIFDGNIVSPQDSDGGLGRTFECQGIWHSDTAIRAETPDLGVVVARDLGDVMGDVLDSTEGARMGPAIRATVGEVDESRGSQGQSKADRIQDLLGKSTGDDGLTNWTWTVGENRRPKLEQVVHPNDATPDYTFRAGQPGIVIDEDKDVTGAPTVYWGTGVDPSGCRYYNQKYIRALPSDGKPFPLSSGTITVGTTDADTTSGTGVTDFHERAELMGYQGAESGATFLAGDVEPVGHIQHDAGLPDTGEIDAATWDWLFAAPLPGDDTPIRRPLASWLAVRPFLYNVHGQVIGDNPDYDPTILRVEVDIDYGENIRKNRARKLALKQLARDAPAPWIGTATITADPNQCFRGDMKAHRYLEIQGLHNADQKFYIAGLEVDPTQDFTVTAQISAAPINLATFDAIRQRNYEARQNPANTYLRSLGKKTGQRPDGTVPWLCEDGAGTLAPGTVIPSGWSVHVVPMAQDVDIVGFRLFTADDVETAGALFGTGVTATGMADNVGDPLRNNTAWDSAESWLDTQGRVYSFGTKDSPGGYYPAEKTDADGNSNSLTGKTVDDGGFHFASAVPPYGWLAIWNAGASTTVSYCRFRVGAE